MQFILDKLGEGMRPPVVGLMLYGTPVKGVEVLRIADLYLGAAAWKLPWLGVLNRFLGSNLADLGPASELLHDIHQGSFCASSMAATCEGAARLDLIADRRRHGERYWVVGEDFGPRVPRAS